MDIFPKKFLGQNFLINQGVLGKIVSAAELNKDDVVLEIGPGTGVLTEKLTERVSRVIAVEKDRRLIEGLREKFKNTNVEIVEGDIFRLDIEALFRSLKLEIRNSNYKVVANIPYYITSHLLKTILESTNWRMVQPSLIVLMVQKEVAQRILAKPPKMNLLALSVQLYSEPKIISYVSKGSFRPIPKIDSAIIKLTTFDKQLTISERENFFKLIKTAFSGKRKQLKNTIGLEVLSKAGIRPESRPEELSLEDWLRMTRYCKMEI